MSFTKILAEIHVMEKRGGAENACRRLFQKLRSLTPRKVVHIKEKGVSHFVQRIASLDGCVLVTDVGRIDLTQVEMIVVYANTS